MNDRDPAEGERNLEFLLSSYRRLAGVGVADREAQDART